MSYRMVRNPFKKREEKGWDISFEKAKKPIIRKFLFTFLASDFAKPKRFSEILKFMNERKICSKRSLSVYLDGLEKEGLIKRIEKGKRHVEFVLVNREKLEKLQKKYKKKMKANVRLMQKQISKLIRKVESGELSETVVKGHVLYHLTQFEDRQFEGLTNLLTAGKTRIFWASSLIEDFFVIPYNLMIQFVWVCYEKYPKVTIEALETLRKYKKEILDLESYVK